MKTGWAAAWSIGLSVLLTLMAAGIIYLVSSRPRGEPVRLLPPPTEQPLVVQVGGSVALPGVYELVPGSRVLDLIQAAGGLLPQANPEMINQAALLQDGELIWVPARQTAESGPTVSTPAQTGHPVEQALNSTPEFPINLNTASVEALQALPSIGEVRAQSIVAYRTANGPFQSIEDIQDVVGIGPGIFEQIKDLITIELAPPGGNPQ